LGVIDNVKEVADLIKKIGDVELYRKIVELEGEIIELTKTNRELEEKNVDLKKKLEIKSKMEFKKPFYFMGDDKQPYCPLCWESVQKAIHLVGPETGPYKSKPWYSCPNCEKTYD
jgi:hypothetical protein